MSVLLYIIMNTYVSILNFVLSFILFSFYLVMLKFKYSGHSILRPLDSTLILLRLPRFVTLDF